jgi:hypothetical protein
MLALEAQTVPPVEPTTAGTDEAGVASPGSPDTSVESERLGAARVRAKGAALLYRWPAIAECSLLPKSCAARGPCMGVVVMSAGGFR